MTKTYTVIDAGRAWIEAHRAHTESAGGADEERLAEAYLAAEARVYETIREIGRTQVRVLGAHFARAAMRCGLPLDAELIDTLMRETLGPPFASAEVHAARLANPNATEVLAAAIASRAELLERLGPLAAHVEAYAQDNYAVDGWSAIVECFTRERVVAALATENATTEAEAIAAMKFYADIIGERMADAENSAF